MKQAAVAILFIFFLLVLRPLAAGQNPGSNRNEQATAQRTLNATVQISLVAPRLDSLGRPVLVRRNGRPHFQLIYDEGLGTAVQAGRRTIIVTHDHWCELTPHLLFVEIRTYDGALLSILEANVFKRSIIYRDGGTMVFLAPETVQTSIILTGQEAFPGEAQVARHSPATGVITLERAWLDSSKRKTGAASRRLELSSGQALGPGDSGGGVWQNGQLTGVLWSVVEEATVGSMCTPRPTAVCIAAELPPLHKLAR